MLRRGPLRIALGCAALAALLIFAASAVAAPRYASRTLKRGSRGPDVKQLQRYLSQLSVHTGVDGVYGSVTTSAVRTFEHRQGQPPTGRVTPSEARLIQKLVADGADSARSANTGGLSPDGSSSWGASQRQGSQSNPGAHAKMSGDGRTAVAPDNAPPAVKAAIAAANRITLKPYRYGGGHRSFNDTAYDCSGSVSYALHGAGLLSRPMDSTGLESWGGAGEGQWITIFANGGHTYVLIAGLRFDTAGSGESGPRWRPQSRSPSGFVERHPIGY